MTSDNNEAQRRYDLARWAPASLPGGKTGLQMAKTTELMAM